MWPFKRKSDAVETRSAMSGFTVELMRARESYISGRRGIAELTGTAQACISLWENGLALADIEGTGLLSRRHMAMAGRALALRGEAVFLIRDTGTVVPCSDWDLSTRDGRPKAYRLSISEAGGGTTETALAGEVLHFRAGTDAGAPWAGSSPLKRAQISSGLLQSIETALAEVYEHGPIGTMIIPFPEAPETDLEALGRGFSGRRGRVLLRESTAVTAAGGPAPAADWRPASTTPDLSKSMTAESLEAARASVLGVFGVLPGLVNPAATGPLVREAQRHLGQWVLQPLAELMAEEVSEKLGTRVRIDVMRAAQAFDAGGRARAAAGIVQALAMAKEAGVDAEKALGLVNWNDPGP